MSIIPVEILGPDVYMDGGEFPGAPSEEVFIGSYMEGEGLSSTVPAYIHAAFGIAGGADCFIEGHTSESLEKRTAIRFLPIEQQRLKIPDRQEYDYLNGFTVNFYVKSRENSNGQSRGVFSKKDVFESYITPGGNSFGMRAKINGIWETALTSTFERNQWYMLTMTYNGSAVRWYRNGQEFLSKNASGDLEANAHDWWMGWSDGYEYAAVDMTQAKVWNYALSNPEILALWQPAYRNNCQPCYICQVEPDGDTSYKRSMIISDISQTNPLTQSVSIGALIAFDAVHDYSQHCFLVAGGETYQEWDTEIRTDFESYNSWDTVIVVRNANEHYNQIQLGDIVYPITRGHRKFIKIISQVTPGTHYGNHDCWIMTYFTAQDEDAGEAHTYIDPLPAFVNAVKVNERAKTCYLHGSISGTETESVGCHITNSSVSTSQSLYMEGYYIYSYENAAYACIVGEHDESTGNSDAYAIGHDSIFKKQSSHIVVGTEKSDVIYCYVHSSATEMDSERSVYIYGAGFLERGRNAYIDGHYSDLPSQNAFILSTLVETSTHEAFIAAGRPAIKVKKALTWGSQPVSVSNPAFIYNEDNVVENVDAFVNGIEQRMWAKRAFIVGPLTTTIQSNKSCYIYQGEPLSKINAFILCGPQSGNPCFIVCDGGSDSEQSCYIGA